MSALKHSTSFAIDCKVNRSLKRVRVKAPSFFLAVIRENYYNWIVNGTTTGYVFLLLGNISKNQIYIVNDCQGIGCKITLSADRLI